MGLINKILEIPQKIVNGVLLTIVYFFGIGISFVLAKIMKKSLFNLEKKKSYWTQYKDEMNYYMMY